MKNNVYQEINLNYKSTPTDGINYENNINVKLINDYSLEDIFDAFVEFIPCLGFGLTRNEVIERLKLYAEEHLPADYNGEK